MTDVRTYIYDVLKESLNTWDKDKLDYFYSGLKAEDYFAAYTYGEFLYNTADCQEEDTKVCSWEEVEDVWDDVLESALIDFAESNMSDEELEEGTISAEIEKVYDDESNYLGEHFHYYVIPEHTEEVLTQIWGEFDSEESSMYNAAEAIMSYLYEKGKIGVGSDEVSLDGIAKFFGATHKAVLEETQDHGTIYSFYRYTSMNLQTLKGQIEELFSDEFISFRFRTYKNGKKEMCISWSCDPTGGNQHDFEYYVSFSSVQELIAGLSEIDPDDVVATEYDIRTDPDFNNDYEFDEDEKSEVKDVCEKWGETLKHVVDKITKEFGQ